MASELTTYYQNSMLAQASYADLFVEINPDAYIDTLMPYMSMLLFLSW